MKEAMQKSAGPVQRRANASSSGAQHENDVAQSPRVVMQRKAMGDGFGGASAPAGGGSGGLPGNLTRGIAALSGMDVSDVSVFRNSSKPAQFKALAFAQDNAIHLAPGQEKHLPHEAWHIVQQRQGRVKADMQMKGGAVNTNAALEREADIKGAEAAQVGASLPMAFASTDPGQRSAVTNGGVVQLGGKKDGDEQQEKKELTEIQIDEPVQQSTSNRRPTLKLQDDGSFVSEYQQQSLQQKSTYVPDLTLDVVSEEIENEVEDEFFRSPDHRRLPTGVELKRILGALSGDEKDLAAALDNFHKKAARALNATNEAAKERREEKAIQWLRLGYAYACKWQEKQPPKLNELDKERRDLGEKKAETFKKLAIETDEKKRKDIKKTYEEYKKLENKINYKQRRIERHNDLISWLKLRIFSAYRDYSKGHKEWLLAYSKKPDAEKSSSTLSKATKTVTTGNKAYDTTEKIREEYDEIDQEWKHAQSSEEKMDAGVQEAINATHDIRDDIASIGKCNVDLTYNKGDNQFVIAYDENIERIMGIVPRLKSKLKNIADLFSLNKLMESIALYKSANKVQKRIDSLKAVDIPGGKMDDWNDIVEQGSKQGLIEYACMKLSGLKQYLRFSMVLKVLQFVMRLLTYSSAIVLSPITEAINKLLSAVKLFRTVYYSLKGAWKFVTGKQGEARKYHAEQLYAGVAKQDPEYSQILFALVPRRKAKILDFRGQAVEKAHKDVTGKEMHKEAQKLETMILFTELARVKIAQSRPKHKDKVNKIADLAKIYIVNTLKGLLKSKPGGENYLLQTLQGLFHEKVVRPLEKAIPDFVWSKYEENPSLIRLEQK